MIVSIILALITYASALGLIIKVAHRARDLFEMRGPGPAAGSPREVSAPNEFPGMWDVLTLVVDRMLDFSKDRIVYVPSLLRSVQLALVMQSLLAYPIGFIYLYVTVELTRMIWIDVVSHFEPAFFISTVMVMFLTIVIASYLSFMKTRRLFDRPPRAAFICWLIGFAIFDLIATILICLVVFLAISELSLAITWSEGRRATLIGMLLVVALMDLALYRKVHFVFIIISNIVAIAIGSTLYVSAVLDSGLIQFLSVIGLYFLGAPLIMAVISCFGVAVIALIAILIDIAIRLASRISIRWNCARIIEEDPARAGMWCVIMIFTMGYWPIVIFQIANQE